jgi:aminopeptidase N
MISHSRHPAGKMICRYILIILLFSSVLLPAAAQEQMSSGGKLKPAQANMDIRHYTIALKVDPVKESISGYAEIDLKLASQSDTMLLDLVQNYSIKEVRVNNKKVNFSHSQHLIHITNPGGFRAGDQKIRVDYEGKPPVAIKPPWQGGFTWTKDTDGAPWIAINCQFEGAKIYFPCKDHPSDEPNEGVDLYINVPKGLVVAGPGLLKSVKDQNNTSSTYHWKTNYTISNYCILFNVADYKVVSRNYTTINNHPVPMEFYVLEKDTANANKVLDIRGRDARILEKYFGEYPWRNEKMGIAYVPNPGMEHQTMISYGDRFTYHKVGGQDYSDNLYHEFAHEWWANKVTNKDWAHMWIQEGIATYAEALAYRELAGEQGYEQKIAMDLSRVKNVQALVQAGEVNTAETYTADIYFKGSYFMHTLRYVMGDELFFPALKKLATSAEFTYDNMVTTEDVEKFFSAEAGRNLKPLFDFYLRTTKKLDFMVEKISEDSYKITLRNLEMDLPVDISSDQGLSRMPIGRGGLIVKSKSLPVVDAKGFYFK